MNDWLAWCQAVLLVSTRLAIGVASTPVFGVFGVPAMARLILVVAFGALVVGAGMQPVVGVLDFRGMASAVMAECAVGLILATGIHCAFAAMSVAGRMLDVQMGFSVGAILDPVSKGHSAVMAGGLNTVAVILFFASNAYAVVLAAACNTYRYVPLHAVSSQARGLEFILTAGGAMFATGLALASPVVVSMLLADLVVAVVSRNMPQMNLLFLSIPLKLLLGLMVLVAAMRVMGPVMAELLSAPADWLLIMTRP